LKTCGIGGKKENTEGSFEEMFGTEKKGR